MCGTECKTLMYNQGRYKTIVLQCGVELMNQYHLKSKRYIKNTLRQVDLPVVKHYFFLRIC